MPEITTDTEWAGESVHDYRYTHSRKPSKSTLNSKISINRQLNFYATFKNKIFASSRYRESVMELRKRAELDKNIDDIALLNAVKVNYPFIYRINDGIGTTNTILQKVCQERGWHEFQERQMGTAYEKAMKGATGWNLWWSYSVYQFSPYKYLRSWQFTNHNPKGFQFCNKLYLSLYLRKMKSVHGSVFDFYPVTFIMPEDYLRLTIDHQTRSESFSLYNHNNMLLKTKVTSNAEDVDNKNDKKRPKTTVSSRKSPHSLKSTSLPTSPVEITRQPEYRFIPIWISKPIGQSQGKGIFLTEDLSNIATDKKSVIQEYICRPLLIGGYKWDIRIYVCVSAIDPLVIYIYQEGLCRFATEKYNTSDLTAMYSHLTNASLNKLSPGYEEDKELIGQGCKWSLRKLRQYFKEHNVSDWYMWQRVMSMVVLTVIGDSLRLGYSATNRNCFDLFGFDVLIDEDLKPWLLECNYSPGLGADCETDYEVKEPMLNDLFNLLGFPDCTSYSEKSDQNKTDNQVTPFFEEDIYNNGFSLDATRQYVDMLLYRIAHADAHDKRTKDQRKPEYAYSSAARLMDAKSIYSQNLVVQYLRNKSNAQGKLSKQVKDKIISLASKQFKKPSTENRQKSKSPPRSTSPQRSSNMIEIEDSQKSSEDQSRIQHDKCDTQNSKKSLEFPNPESEAFQRLKHYFDAGVDYPVDIKTGKFKECPALITARKDWSNPPKQQGQWIRVYPFDARSTKSPYKSSLTDIRQAVRSIESYMKVAEHLFMVKPDESDEYYRKKLKTICRREPEIWTPPLTWGLPSTDCEYNEHSA